MMVPYFALAFFTLAASQGTYNIPKQDISSQSDQAYWKDLGKKEIYRALRNRDKLNEGIAKNVILFVGDGMGPNTITAARVFRDGESSSLVFEQFPNVGLLKTYAVDTTVPDSACTATAIFTGVKTNFETVGVDGGVKLRDCDAAANKSHQVSSIVQWAQDAGKATGFVTNTRVTHATPSSLYAHSADRRWECENSLPASATKCKDMARQLVEDEPGRLLQVIMGGGRQVLQAGGLSSGDMARLNQWSCARKDGLDLIQAWKDDKIKRQVSYKFLRNTGDLKSLNWDTDYVMGIFADSHMLYDDERDTSDSGSPTLADMTKVAIQVLQKNKKGFVLMVEGGMIDQAHHRGEVRRAMVETVRFHEAIQVAQELTNASDTLLIVTADHAHGLTINGLVSGRNNIMGNTIPSKADGKPFNILSYMTGSAAQLPYKVVDQQIVRDNPEAVDNTKPDYMPQVGLPSDEVAHGGVDVNVFAQGPMAHLFNGVNEQTHVAHVIAYAAGIGEFTGRGTQHDDATNQAGGLTAPPLLILLILITLFIY